VGLFKRFFHPSMSTCTEFPTFSAFSILGQIGTEYEADTEVGAVARREHRGPVQLSVQGWVPGPYDENVRFEQFEHMKMSSPSALAANAGRPSLSSFSRAVGEERRQRVSCSVKAMAALLSPDSTTVISRELQRSPGHAAQHAMCAAAFHSDDHCLCLRLGKPVAVPCGWASINSAATHKACRACCPGSGA